MHNITKPNIQPSGKNHPPTNNLWSFVMLELTSHCNFNCSFCPSDTMKREHRIMPRELWEKIIHELGQKKMVNTVFFHLLGEPLLHKDLFDAIRLANEYNLTVSLYTNGALLDEKKSLALLDTLKKGGVVLSIQEISPESFNKRSRGKLSWHQYINRLQNFIKLSEKHENQVPVQIHFMVDIQKLGWNLPSIFQEQRLIQSVYHQWVKALGYKRTEKINILNPTRSYQLGNNSTFFIKHSRNWDNQLIDNNLVTIPRHTGHCTQMTDTFAILSDGTCTYCCTDYEGDLKLGNALEQSLEDIYYGEKAVRIRDTEKRGKFIEERCKVCRGILINKKNRKPVSSRNILTDYYIFKNHINSFGFISSMKKVREAAQRRGWF